MQDEKQFEQLIFQYEQLKQGSEEIRRLLEKDDFDAAITMIKNREPLFLNCKCMRRYLDFSEEQQKQHDIVFNELRELELANIRYLEENMAQVKDELRKTQKMEKIQNAYQYNENQRGSIVNYTDID